MSVTRRRIVPSERTAQDISIVEVLYEEFGITSREENGNLVLDPGFVLPEDSLLEEAKERYFQKIRNSRYREERYAHYPSIVDQLDMLYHDILQGRLETGTWMRTISEIKRTFPKLES